LRRCIDFSLLISEHLPVERSLGRGAGMKPAPTLCRKLGEVAQLCCAAAVANGRRFVAGCGSAGRGLSSKWRQTRSSEAASHLYDLDDLSEYLSLCFALPASAWDWRRLRGRGRAHTLYRSAFAGWDCGKRRDKGDCYARCGGGWRGSRGERSWC